MGWVILKMLPFDNKSEFQVVVDMPVGTPLEQTAGVLRELGAFLASQPEVSHYQAYAGTASPINFNGLMRQYYLRSGGEVGDLQVTLLDKAPSLGEEPRHRQAAAARRCRRSADAWVPTSSWSKSRPARRCCRRWWPRSTGRKPRAGSKWRAAVRTVLEATPGVVDVDDSSIAAAPRKLLLIDRRKAALLGVPQAAIVSTLRAGLGGEDAAYLHDESKYPAPALLQLPAERHGELDALLQLQVRGAAGQLGADPRARHRHRHGARAAGPSQGPAAGELRHRRRGRPGGQPALRHVRRPRAASLPQDTGRRLTGANTSSASRATLIATTPSNGTANGRSPTKPSATWASPMPSG